ncbi:hypothetical protein BH11PLA2_BH11PLA2_19700 [soil metagenome]
MSEPRDQRMVWLDLARGLSAIAVCFDHLHPAFLPDYDTIAQPPVGEELFYFFTGLGHQAVAVFFVLSGMFVGGSVLNAGSRFRFGKYAIARLTRLWVVLIPALVVTAIADSISLRNEPRLASGLLYEVWHTGAMLPGADFSRSPTTFFGNLAFLQTTLVPVFGSNSPLWSLANEFWYYVLFPLMVTTARLETSIPRRVLCALLLVLLFLGLPDYILYGFLIWLMGVVAIAISWRLTYRVRIPALLVTAAAFVYSLLLSRNPAWPRPGNLPVDVILGAAFAAFAIVLARWPEPRRNALGRVIRNVIMALAEPSYSLYLFHFPLIVCIASSTDLDAVRTVNARAFVMFFGCFLLLMVVNAGVWFLFERNTTTIRRWITKRLTNRHMARGNAAAVVTR